MKYASVGQFLEQVAQRNPGQPEFLQAVTEVMESLWPFIEKHPRYAEQALKILLGDVLPALVHGETANVLHPWVKDLAVRVLPVRSQVKEAFTQVKDALQAESESPRT